MINDFYVANPDRTPSLLDSFPISKSGFVAYVNTTLTPIFLCSKLHLLFFIGAVKEIKSIKSRHERKFTPIFSHHAGLSGTVETGGCYREAAA